MRFSKKGRIICAILVCVVSMTSFSGFAELKVNAEEALHYNVIWDEDFEDSEDISYYDIHPFQGVSIEKDSSSPLTKTNNYMKFVMTNTNEGKWPEFYVDFDDPVTSGTLYVGYDIARTDSGRTYDAYLKDANSTWNNGGLFVGTMCAGNTNKNISYYTNMHVDAILSPLPVGKEITKSNNYNKKWHHVDSWIDLDNRIVTHYFDGELLGTTGITDELTQIVRYKRPGNGGYGTGTEYLDNYKIIHIPEVGFDIEIDGARVVPEYLKEAAMVSISTEKLGNNTFEQIETLTVNVKSNVNSTISGTITLEVVDENGNSVAKENRSVSFGGKADVAEKFEIALPYFGYYNATAMFNAEGKNPSEAEAKLVRLREAEEQNQKLGYSAHSSWNYGTEKIVEKQELFARAGFKYQRDSTFFSEYEHEKTNGESGYDYYYTEIDQRIQNSFESTDIEMLQLIEGVEAAIGKKLPESEEEYDRFYAYVYNLALDLSEKGVIYYEILNEVDYSKISGDTIIERAENYTNMQKTAYEAIKDACKITGKDSVVICGATARVPVEWIEQLLKAGAGEYFDSFSCHPYTVENMPELGRVSQGDGTAENMVLTLRGLLDKYGLYDKGIEITELAYSAAGAGYAENEVEQAAYGLRQYMMVQPHVGVFIWYNDQNKSTAADLESNFGLIRNWNEPIGAAYQAKPVLVSFSAFNSIVGNAESLGKVDVGDDDVWIYKFKRADGKDVLAVWSKNDTEKTIALELGAECSELSDMYGNTTTLHSDNGIFNFDISGSITYLTGNFDKTILREPDSSPEELTVISQSNVSVTGGVPSGWTPASNVVYLYPDVIADKAAMRAKFSSKAADRPTITYSFAETDNNADTQVYEIEIYRPSSVSNKQFFIDFFSDGAASDGTVNNSYTRGFIRVDGSEIIIPKNLVWMDAAAQYNASSHLKASFESDKWHTLKLVYRKKCGHVDFYLDETHIGVSEVDYKSFTSGGVKYNYSYPKLFRIGAYEKPTTDINGLYIGDVKVSSDSEPPTEIYSVEDAVDTNGNKTVVLNQDRATVISDSTNSGRGNIVEMKWKKGGSETAPEMNTYMDIEIPAYTDSNSGKRFVEFDIYKTADFGLTYEFMSGDNYFYVVGQPNTAEDSNYLMGMASYSDGQTLADLWNKTSGAAGIWMQGTFSYAAMSGWGNYTGYSSFSNNAWHNLRFEVDNESNKLSTFIDGSLVASGAITLSKSDFGGDLKLRVRAPLCATDNLSMYIDNLKIGYEKAEERLFTENDVKLINAVTGYEVTGFNALQELAVKADVVNDTEAKMMCKVIWAAYSENDTVIDVGITGLTVPENGRKSIDHRSTDKIAFTAPAGAKTVKAFLWLDGGAQLQPLCNLSSAEGFAFSEK